MRGAFIDTTTLLQRRNAFYRQGAFSPVTVALAPITREAL